MNKKQVVEPRCEISKLNIEDIKKDVRHSNAQASFRRKPYGNSVFTEFIQEIDHDQIILEEQQRMRNAGIGFSETKQCGFRDAYVMGV